MKGTRPEHLNLVRADCWADENVHLREAPDEDDNEEDQPDKKEESDEDEDNEGYSE